ncbi:MAG: MFS transporter [Candidatus Omnitrophota bacterium]|nr:MFS transporter [Candidatus Omnitrophota bacterium]
MIGFLIKNRNFSRLWLAQLISQFGDRVHQLALVGLIAERASGSTMGLAKLLAFTIIPVFLVQPFAGVLVDRWDKRTTLLICDLIRGMLIFTIPFIFIFWESMVPIYIVVFLSFCCSRFYVPAKMSIIPDVVGSESLLKANSLVTTTGMIAAGLGGMVGAFLIEYFGARNGFLIDSITFFISAFLLFNMRLPWRLLSYRPTRTMIIQKTKELAVTIKKSLWDEMREGVMYLFKQSEIRFVMNTFFVLLAAAGSIYVVMIVFIQERFHSVTKDLGILAVFLVIGLFSGVMAYGKWGKNISWQKTIGACLTAGGLMLLTFAMLIYQYPNIFLGMILACVWGFTIGPVFVASNTIIHLVSNEEMRGKVFSSMEIVIHFAFLVAMLISSWVSEFVDKGWILSVVGMGCAVYGGISLWKTRHSNLAFSTPRVA